MERTQQTARTASADSLVGRYRPIDNVMDEMVDSEGQLRPGWDTLIQTLDTLGPEALNERFARASQYLRDAGVYYRVYGDGEANERDWPLANIPLLIDEKQWSHISAGVAQRAELLERVVADIYGDSQLIEQGLLPPELVASNPEFLRPAVGVTPASGHYLHFCAFELGRGPDGQWWVLGDRTQAPSGAGFALENRVATIRAFSDVITQLRVHRLAGFFGQFKTALSELVNEPNGIIGILTPGAWNETYYEHTYIARYLGFMLLEGENLVVKDDRVMVRTVTGLEPVSVLWRRLDGAFADPLELNANSFIGTPGLMHALRHGHTAMVNAIGSGVVEMRALAAFLPSIARYFEEPLKLPTIATWWCGQSSERDYVIDNFDGMLIGGALSTRLPFDDEQAASLGARLPATERDELIAALQANGAQFVGQEPVNLSTTPVYVDGNLEPRPLILRVFAARDGERWNIMPGGFARVGYSLDTAAVSMQRGGQAADVWIVSDHPVRQYSLLPDSGEKFVRRAPGNLTSTAGENLLWLGRYVERSEQIVRILRAYHARLAEADDPHMPLLQAVREHLDLRNVDATQPIPDGLINSIDSAINSAGKIRDRFSPDGWIALTDLARTSQRFKSHIRAGNDTAAAMTVLLRKLGGFSGLVHENMYQYSAWRFLEIGRRLERAIQTAALVNRLLGPKATHGASDMMLEIGDSVMTYRRFYSVNANRSSALDLMALDPANPRSVFYQIGILKTEIHALPNSTSEVEMSDIAKTILKLHTDLAVKQADEITPDDIDELIASLLELSNAVAQTYFL